MMRRVSAPAGSRALAAAVPAAAGTCVWAQQRTIIVPNQLVAYGGHFNTAKNRGFASILPDNYAVRTQVLPGRVRRSVATFEEMQLPTQITDGLEALGVTVPSPVQQIAIKPLRRRENMVVAAPAGTGKTLAYLAPIFANLLDDRDVHRIPTRERRPRVIICCPTKETVAQTADVCRRLGGPLGFRTAAVAPYRRRAKRAKGRMMKRHLADVLVASPHVVAQLIRARRLFTDDLRTVVMDEADALLGSMFDGEAGRLLNMINKRALYKHLWPVDTQRVLVSAAVTQPVQKFASLIPDVRQAIAPGTHEPNPHQMHQFFRCNLNHERETHLRWLLDQSGNRAMPWPSDDPETCPRDHDWPPLPNSVDSGGAPTDAAPDATAPGEAAADAWNTLQTRPQDSGSSPPMQRASGPSGALVSSAAHDPAGLGEDTVTAPATCVWQHLTTKSAPFSGAVRRLVNVPGERVVVFFKNIDRCTALFHQLHHQGYRVTLVHGTLPGHIRDRNFRRWATGQCNVLLTTDLLSRGIDYRVDRVINFDAPKTPVEYLARAGRTGRMGRTGKVQTLFGKRDETTVSVVRTFVRGGIAMENVSHQAFQTSIPTYAHYVRQKKDAVAKRFVKMITTRRIPAHLEKKYLRKDATWRPIYQPEHVAKHGGIRPEQQRKLQDKVTAAAVERRRQIEANIKGGSAKFGRAGRPRALKATQALSTGQDGSWEGTLKTPQSPLKNG